MATYFLPITMLLWLLVHGPVVHAESPPTVPPRLALVISISKFRYHQAIPTADDGWKMAFLLGKQGFTVYPISNEAATVAGVQAAFGQLIQRVRGQPGAVVVVYVSSHGASLKNENSRDDPEPDGRDEAIVCYDSPDRPNNRQVIIDDQVGKWFDTIRTEIGASGQLVYFLDACFSNTGIRSNDRRAVKFGGPARLADDSSTGDFDVSAETSAGTQPATQAGWGKLVAFFAADAGKMAWILPGNNMSAMTVGLYNALLTIRADRTYQDLFRLLQDKTKDAVRKAFHNDRLPSPVFIMGSPGVGSEKLFNGYFTPMNAVLIEPRRFAFLGEAVKVPRSTYGTTKGSVYAFRRGDDVVARGIVQMQTDEYDYVSLLPGKAGDGFGPSDSLTATVDEFNYRGMETTVALALTDPLLERELRDRIRQGRPDLLVLTAPGGSAQILVRQTANRIEFYQAGTGLPVAPPLEGQQSVRAVAGQVDQQLRTIALYRLLNQLEPEQPQSRVKLMLHPAVIQRLYQGRPIDRRDRSHPGQDYTRILRIDDTLAFRRYRGLVAVDTSQQAVLRLQNTTADSLYFNLLDVDPFRNVTLLWPSLEDSRADDPTFFLLKPHETKDIPFTDFNPPFGLEEFRLLTSRRPIDLRDFLDNQRWQGRKGGADSASLLGATTVLRYYILSAKP